MYSTFSVKGFRGSDILYFPCGFQCDYGSGSRADDEHGAYNPTAGFNAPITLLELHFRLLKLLVWPDFLEGLHMYDCVLGGPLFPILSFAGRGDLNLLSWYGTTYL